MIHSTEIIYVNNLMYVYVFVSSRSCRNTYLANWSHAGPTNPIYKPGIWHSIEELNKSNISKTSPQKIKSTVVCTYIYIYTHTHTYIMYIVYHARSMFLFVLTIITATKTISNPTWSHVEPITLVQKSIFIYHR